MVEEALEMKPPSRVASPASVSVDEALRLFEMCNGPEMVEEACAMIPKLNTKESFAESH